MSIVKSKNFSYLRGPKGEKGDRGEPGSGVAGATGRITYNTSTKTIGFNDVGLATENYVDTSISNLINGAPGVLDTLRELALAINDDANFFANITSTISGKLSLSGGTMTGAITLAGAPTSNLHAATKKYVDDATTAITINSTTDVPEGTNLYYTTAKANTDFDTRLATKTTTNLTEGSNLYYTTARFDSRLATKTTADLTEGTNLYYTTARANTDFDTRLATKTTTNLTEGTNKYYTDARARLAISASGDLNYNNSTGVMSYTTPFIPTDISELTDNLGLLVTTSLPAGTIVDGGTY